MPVNHCERNKKIPQLSICDFQGSYRVVGIQTASSPAKWNKLWETQRKSHCCLHSPCLGRTQCKVHLPDLLPCWLIKGWPKHKGSSRTDRSSDHTTAGNYPVGEVATENIKTTVWRSWNAGPHQDQAALPIPSISATASGRNVPCPLLSPAHTRVTGNGEGHRGKTISSTTFSGPSKLGASRCTASMALKTPSLCFWSQQTSLEMHRTHDPQMKFLVDNFKKSLGP